MPVDQSQRALFYEGQYLDADDLSQAFDHSRIQLARHILGGHTYGIALGLNLREMPSAEDPNLIQVTLQPGYAWDGFGRPIVVLAPSPLPADRFQAIPFDPAIDANNPPGRLVEVWIRYREFNTRPPAANYGLCDGTDQNSRVQETFQIEIGRYTASSQRDPILIGGIGVDPRNALSRFDPAAGPLPDESVPHQDVPVDNPDAWWLVPVGKVRWLPNPVPNQPGAFVAATAGDRAISSRFRTLAGLVGGSIEAPDGQIRVKDRKADFAPVPSADLLSIEGKLRVNDDIRLFKGAIDFRDQNGGADDLPLKVSRGGNAAGGQDLQVAIGQMNPANNRFVAGPLDNTGAIKPNFSVLDSGNVGIGTGTPAEKLHVSGGKIRWANSLLTTDQGGSIELGGDPNTAGVGSPAINFHFNGLQQPFNTRVINDANGRLRIDAGVLSASGRIGVGTNAPGEAVEIANDGNLLFKASANDPGDVIFQDSNGNQKARIWSNPVAGPGLNFSSGDINPDILIDAVGNVGIGTPAPASKLHVAGDLTHTGGRILSDRWKISQVLNNIAGPLPRNGVIQVSGGTLVIFASGTGFSIGANSTIGMNIEIDGVFRGAAESFTNEGGSHKAFTANALVIAGVPAGNRNFSLVARGAATRTDFNDRFSLTVLELPF